MSHEKPRPAATHSLAQKTAGEAMGACLLVAAVVSSGIMAVKLSGGNVGLALLANAVATGAALVVLITALGPVSGAHFNPMVSLVFWRRGELPGAALARYVPAQIAGGIAGTLLAHLMFDLPVQQWSASARTGPGQWVSEAVASFGLVVTILMVLRARADFVATAVGLYIVSAYWFTASTSFANPAVTIARAFTGTFAGIAPAPCPGVHRRAAGGRLCGPRRDPYAWAAVRYCPERRCRRRNFNTLAV